MSDTHFSTPDTLMLHYIFSDDSHSMNANIQNKCEAEILKIVKEVAEALGIEHKVEVLPPEEGSFINRLKVFFTGESNTISHQMFLAFVAFLLGVGYSEYNKDPEKDKKQERLLDLQINNAEADSIKNALTLKDLNKKKIDTVYVKFEELAERSTIRKKKSNFYKHLSGEQKVQRIGYNVLSDDEVIINDMTIERPSFKDFILATDDLDPIEDEEALIEIISPVLKAKSKAKWTGIYKADEIPFKMKSSEFLQLVHAGRIEFKNGFQINCELIISRKTDDDGNPRITGYTVETVNKYYVSDKPIETKEGKKKKRKKKKDDEDEQLAMF